MDKSYRKRRHEHSQFQRGHKIQRRCKEKFEIVERVKSQRGITGQLIFWYGTTNTPPISVLTSATNRINATLEIRKLCVCPTEKGNFTFALYINNELIVEGSHPSELVAKRCLSELAVEKLQKSCFSIYRKINFADSPMVDLQKDEATAKLRPQPATGGIGAQMLLKMGWTGGGLGINKQGITEIIKPTNQVYRQGFGTKHSIPIDEIKKVLQNYAASDDINSISFSPDFTKEERALIHSMATKMNLKSTSYGTKERRLVIQKKCSYWQIIDTLLEMGGENEQYRLLKPTRFDINKYCKNYFSLCCIT
ncbi:hypothetical protein FQA39_LY15845 [Lamprigera yunnana]|nr:hypothetical protein FQA39_LY15845 [Lamprigera yunnana]